MKRGFTLSELLLVVTIIAILAVMTLLSFQKQTIRGFDSKRKTDLAMFKVLFDDYYNDHACYPTKEQWDAYDCATKANGDFLKPYLGGKDIPCDPKTNERYLYIALPEGVVNACSGYKLFAALGITTDPDIIASGCDPNPQKGCGYEPYKYNYGISMGGVIINPAFDFNAPILTPTPTVSHLQENNFCLGDGSRTCNTKAGLVAPDYDNRPCSDVLRELGCTSFFDGALCRTKCQNEYTTYACPQTETIRCW